MIVIIIIINLQRLAVIELYYVEIIQQINSEIKMFFKDLL